MLLTTNKDWINAPLSVAVPFITIAGGLSIGQSLDSHFGTEFFDVLGLGGGLVVNAFLAPSGTEKVYIDHYNENSCPVFGNLPIGTRETSDAKYMRKQSGNNRAFATSFLLLGALITDTIIDFNGMEYEPLKWGLAYGGTSLIGYALSRQERVSDQKMYQLAN